MLPKNSGLELYRQELEGLPNEKVIVRAEDVPVFVEEMIQKGKKVIGLTGEDLYKEYKLKNVISQIGVIEKIPWVDQTAIFNKPTLCLLGPIGKKLKNLACAKQGFAKPETIQTKGLQGVNKSRSFYCEQQLFLDISSKPKVAINSKYKYLSEKFLKEIEQKGFSFDKMYLNGCTEEAYQMGLCDLVIDIVYSGKSAREAGLGVIERIMESDIVLLGVRK